MIEHDPWVGPLYKSEGLQGQRIGVVGYSHWTPDDHPRFTVDCMEHVVAGRWKIGFFNSIAGYFDMDVAAFYNRVVMFEFVPCAIGGPDERYHSASAEQVRAGGERMLRITEEQAIDKLLVFTAKGWRSAPPTIEDVEKKSVLLGETRFRVGHYEVGGRTVAAFGLRHPQYAPKALMRQAVQHALAA